jgi:hypothetical protein
MEKPAPIPLTLLAIAAVSGYAPVPPLLPPTIVTLDGAQIEKVQGHSPSIVGTVAFTMVMALPALLIALYLLVAGVAIDYGDDFGNGGYQS